MPYEDAKTYRFNPFDLTKIWPHSDYPLIKVGTMTLNRNPENFFAADRAGGVRAEQRSCRASGFSPDKMLLGARLRLHRHAPLPDRPELPAAAGQPPAGAGATPTAGRRRWPTSTAATDPVYAPNTYGGPATPTRRRPAEDGLGGRRRDGPRRPTRCAPTTTTSARPARWSARCWTTTQRERVRRQRRRAPARRRVASTVLERAFEYWKNVDAEIGKRIEQAVGATVGA